MSHEYNKDFDSWNQLKKHTDATDREVYAYPREVWWCTLGVNIGVESDGKNENFERPVLIVKVYNKQSMLVLPLTAKVKNDKFHANLKMNAKDERRSDFTRTVSVKLTQARVISNKRLLRKVDVVKKKDFDRIVSDFRVFT